MNPRHLILLPGKIPWRRERLPIAVFWPGEFQGVYIPWGLKEWNMTDRFSFSILLQSCTLGQMLCCVNNTKSPFYKFWQFSSVQSFIRVWLFATPWIAAHQASLSITNSQSSLRLTSIESVMPSSHLILCHPLLLLPPIPPSIRVLSNESTLHMRWPKYWSFSFSIIPSKEYPGLIFRMDWLDLLAVCGTLESSPTPQLV